MHIAAQPRPGEAWGRAQTHSPSENHNGRLLISRGPRASPVLFSGSSTAGYPPLHNLPHPAYPPGGLDRSPAAGSHTQPRPDHNASHLLVVSALLILPIWSHTGNASPTVYVQGPRPFPFSWPLGLLVNSVLPFLIFTYQAALEPSLHLHPTSLFPLPSLSPSPIPTIQSEKAPSNWPRTMGGGIPTPPLEDHHHKSSHPRKSSSGSKSLKPAHRGAKRSSTHTSAHAHAHHEQTSSSLADGRHKRVWKACERCRMKKTKVGVTWPQPVFVLPL